MKLDLWCDKNPDKVPALREHFGKTNLIRYRNGDRVPGEKAMKFIARFTGYQTTANDFYGIDPQRAAEASKELAAA